MGYTITQANLDNCRRKAFAFAYKHKLDGEELYLHLCEKLIRLASKYDESRCISFDGYANKFIKGYLLNYIRDYVYPKALPRKWLACVMRYNKLLQIGWLKEQASISAGMYVEDLEHASAQMLQSRYGKGEPQAWQQLGMSKADSMNRSKLSESSMRLLENVAQGTISKTWLCENIHKHEVALQDALADYCPH